MKRTISIFLEQLLSIHNLITINEELLQQNKSKCNTFILRPKILCDINDCKKTLVTFTIF